MKEMQYSCECQVHGSILTLLNISVQEQRNPLRVAEVVQESSTRTAKSYPATPIAFPGGERITPIIYVGGELAESRVSFMDGIGIVPQSDVSLQAVSSTKNILPLREIVRFAQGIALLKINEKSRFSCNSTEV